MVKLNTSPIQKISFQGYDFLVKRDDLLHPDFSGNKARKFHYFLQNDFPNIDTVVSYGSNQSNAMYSLSVLCKLKGWRFIYYMDHISAYLKENPQGNYKYALQNGMEIKVNNEKFELKSLELSSYLRDSIKDNELFIDEGGAVKEAQFGIKILADEIKEYQEQNGIKDLKVFLPSGTGTTALFLQKYLDIEVLTCPCVGNGEYLKKQFLELEKDESIHPTILIPPRKFHFGKLYKENYQIWLDLKKETGIEFDLLYDPIGWQTLLNQKSNIKNLTSNIIYLHQGGLLGNGTMVTRYNHKWCLSEFEV